MDFEDRIYLSLPFLLKLILGVLLLVVVVAYGIFQARYIIAGPQIALTEEPPTVTEDASIIVRGQAENIVTITLNGREIYTTDEGRFAETVTLQKGYTVLTIEGVDRYGSRARIERMITRK